MTHHSFTARSFSIGGALVVALLLGSAAFVVTLPQPVKAQAVIDPSRFDEARIIGPIGLVADEAARIGVYNSCDSPMQLQLQVINASTDAEIGSGVATVAPGATRFFDAFGGLGTPAQRTEIVARVRVRCAVIPRGSMTLQIIDEVTGRTTAYNDSAIGVNDVALIR